MSFAVGLYKAIYEYTSTEASELSIVEGESLLAIEFNDQGWALVERVSASNPKDASPPTGWVPQEYLERVDDAKPVSSTKAVTGSSSSSSSSTSSPSSHPIISSTVEDDGSVGKDDDEDDAPPPPPGGAVPHFPESEAKSSSATSTTTTATAAAAVPTTTTAATTTATPESAAAAVAVPACATCKKPLGLDYVLASGHKMHKECFVCAHCSISLAGSRFLIHDGQYYCVDGFYDTFGETCHTCKAKVKGQHVSALGKHYHPEHFVCFLCSTALTGSYVNYENSPVCSACHINAIAPKCAQCNLPITSQALEAMGKKYHDSCFMCCSPTPHKLDAGSYYEREGKAYCSEHFAEIFSTKCDTCKKPILNECLQVEGKSFHPNCWVCSICKSDLASVGGVPRDDGSYLCLPCKRSLSAATPVSRPSAASTSSSAASASASASAAPVPEKQQQLPPPPTSSSSTTTTTGPSSSTPHPSSTTTTTTTTPSATAMDTTKAAPTTASTTAPEALIVRQRILSTSAPSETVPSSSSSSTNNTSNYNYNNNPERTERKSVTTVPPTTYAADATKPKEPRAIFVNDSLSQEVFTYSELTQAHTFPPNVDRSCKEKYLSDAEFDTVFGMTKEKFYSQAVWKQANLKKAAGLF